MFKAKKYILEKLNSLKQLDIIYLLLSVVFFVTLVQLYLGKSAITY